MPSQTYQVPQLQQSQSQPTGQLLNTNPAPQMAPDKNTASLSMPPNQAMTNLGFANNMLHHLIQYKGSKSNLKQVQQSQQSPEMPKEPKQPEPPKEQPNPDAKVNELESNITKQIADLRQEFKDEIGTINQSIKEALNEKE